MSDIYTLIGSRVREERKLRGLSIEKLAELAGVTPSFLGLIERGERKLSVLTLDKISKALQSQPNELMRTQNKKSAPLWERKIQALINSQPENAKELIFKLLNCLVKNLPTAR